jgi:hypothetical protein
MSEFLLSVMRPFISIPASATRCGRRGFAVRSVRMAAHLEGIGMSFSEGYHAALDGGPLISLVGHLEVVDDRLRGFAYEGAAMGVAIADRFRPTRSARFHEFLAGPGWRHRYMVHVGLGWMLARLPRTVLRMRHRLDPVLWPLAIDGAGFHAGFFTGRSYARRMRPPWYASGPWGAVFDQGFGRSLWFQAGGRPDLIQEAIAGFPVHRRADLWSGVGLGCAYAGGAPADDLAELQAMAGDYRNGLAQGVAFAVTARETAGTPAFDTGMACELLLGRATSAVRPIVERHLAEATGCSQVQGGEDVRFEDGLVRYQDWRARLRREFAGVVPITVAGVAAGARR